MNGQPRLDGKKFDEGKPQMSFIARSLLIAIATIMAPGAVKYGRDNWKGGMLWSRPGVANCSLAAKKSSRACVSAFSHFRKWLRGDMDEDHAAESHL